MDITGLSSVRFTAPVSVDQTRLAAPQVSNVSTPVVADNGMNVTATNTVKPVPPSDSEIKQSIKEVNKYLKETLNGIEFSQDKDTGQTLVKIVDTTSGKVIRQIPTAQAVEISKDISKLQGLLIKDKA
ncbi:flagellar protein FlaG [Actimicrobium sp. CCI2.3]|uniref:flagellar protein FlaG n=1 Tax=Actimicrobium sp. CCI2.3 TaxID=3048616 RepID=UPI002AB5C090|nr:flagellar protein FlaG [Actimicrobium sp. CCI2.3]MDY7573028.1 flagellar protein FlaG [Actimicrobium sp. CCI2.3]MEB0020825.1 flagellar protein FlaG [Actimicrobium sp. CCI2.3]